MKFLKISFLCILLVVLLASSSDAVGCLECNSFNVRCGSSTAVITCPITPLQTVRVIRCLPGAYCDVNRLPWCHKDHIPLCGKREVPRTTRKIVPRTTRKIVPRTTRKIEPRTTRKVVPRTTPEIEPRTTRDALPITTRGGPITSSNVPTSISTGAPITNAL